MRMDFSYLVVMKHVVTAVIIIFEFPCLIELEKESCVYYPCIRGDHKKDKRGDQGTALLPPTTKAQGCCL